MSARLGTQPAVNRLLPYRGLHTDLVAHERYYTFNEPATASPVDMTAWTPGASASVSSLGDPERFDGANTHLLSSNALNANVYIQSSVTNLDTAIPCTVRLVVRSPLPFPESFSTSSWIRVYDPGDANTDVWFHVASAIVGPGLPTDFTGASHVCTGEIGNVGSDVIEARITNPIPEMTNVAAFTGSESSDYAPGGAAGDSNHFLICEFELPAAASRTIRIQRVTSNGATTLAGGTDPVVIARAEVLQGKVSRWTCRRTGRTFSQPTPSLQPYARPMGVPEFNGRRVLRFSNGQYLKSDDPPAEWAFLNSGAECSVYAVAMNTADDSGYVLATTQFAPTTDGFNIAVDPALDEWSVAARNAATTQIFDIRATRALNTLYVIGYRALDGHEDGDAVADIGGNEYVANASNWSAGSPPTHTLYIGCRPPGAVFWDGYIADTAIYDVRLDDDEHARVFEEFESWNACACSIPGCVLAVAADHGVIGNPVTQWRSRVGTNHLYTSLFDGGAPIAPPAESNSVRGSLRMTLDNLQGFALFPAALITDLNAEHAVIACVQALSDDGVIWEHRDVGTNTYERLEHSGGQWVYTRRAHGGSTDAVSAAAADTRQPHVHTFLFMLGQRNAWIDGTPLFVGVPSNPGTMTGVDWTSLGGGYDGGSGLNLGVTEFAVYNVAPFEGYKRQLVERAMRRRVLGLDRLGDGTMKLGVGIGQGHSLGQPSAPSTKQTLRFHTWFGSTTWTPDSSGSDTVLECWSGGGGGTTATGAGGGGAYARDDSYTRTAGVGITITIGEGGAAGGGTGGTTSIGATCIAVGAVGNKGGLAASCTGDVTRSGGDGATGTGNSVGGASPGSSTEASGTTSGEPDGGLGANANSNNASKIPGGGGRSTGANQYTGAQGLARATYHEPATPGLPAINKATSQRSNGTSHAVTIPEGPGDTIVYFIFTDGAPTIQLAGDVGTTVLSQSNGTACTLQVMTHPAADAPTSVELSQSEWVSVIALRVQDLATVSGTTASDTGTNADPPSHDMGSAAPTLWFTGMVIDSETNGGDITGNAPSGYEDSIFLPTPHQSAGVACMIAWRATTAQTENPGNFTNQTGEHCTFTLGMRS